MERKEKTKRMGEVIGYDHFGRGIIKQEGKVVFVPHVKKGDTVSYIMVKEKSFFSFTITIRNSITFSLHEVQKQPFPSCLIFRVQQ